MKKYKISLLFFLFSGLHISAQNKLTIQQAIDIALQENLSISLARTDFQMAKASNMQTIATPEAMKLPR